MIKKIIKEMIEFIKHLNDEYESKNPYMEDYIKKYTDEY